MATHPKRSAFTLTEIIVVTAIVVLLASLIGFAVWPAAKTASKKTVCSARLKQVGLAIQMYMTDYDGWPPPSLDLLEGYEYWCPLNDLAYGFTGNFVGMNSLGHPEWVSGFEESLHAVVKCYEHSNYTGRFGSHDAINVHGEHVEHKYPWPEEPGVEVLFLGAFLSGSVRWVPAMDEYMTDSDDVMPPSAIRAE